MGDGGRQLVPRLIPWLRLLLCLAAVTTSQQPRPPPEPHNATTHEQVAAAVPCRIGNLTIPCRPGCESTPGGCSDFSVISAGTCATAPGSGCTPLSAADCESVPGAVDFVVAKGNKHFHVGAAQQHNTPTGCLLHPNPAGTAFRLKYNNVRDDGGAVLCSHAWQCLCWGACAPVARPDPGARHRSAGGSPAGGGRGPGTQGSTESPAPPSEVWGVSVSTAAAAVLVVCCVCFCVQRSTVAKYEMVSSQDQDVEDLDTEANASDL